VNADAGGCDPISVDPDRAAARLVVATVLPVPAAQLWRAVTDPHVISTWFEPTEPVPVVAGRDRPEWRIRFTDDGQPHVKTARLLEVEPGQNYVIEWLDPGCPDSVLVVRVSELRPAGAPGRESRLELEHREVPAELFDGYVEGWPDYVRGLRRKLSTPIRPGAGRWKS
jgi:uncharacterized protein YndB with AHSA1/START domain